MIYSPLSTRLPKPTILAVRIVISAALSNDYSAQEEALP